MSQTVKVYQVKSVKLSIDKNLRATLNIHADGVVRTLGYKNPRLEPFVYIQPPVDGIWDFNFVADSPDGPVGQALSAISADYMWESFPEDLKGVRIHSETNSVEERLEVFEPLASR